ncbi:MAG: DUF4846 domain-containing protein [Thermoanaerobaculia bacterium]|nr:DUF4846 domain-containing protein [Thermoanaerobaculia bacterium]
MNGSLQRHGILLVLALFLVSSVALSQSDYSWPHAAGAESLEATIDPPPGFARVPSTPGSFAAWLRGLPLRPRGASVELFDGRPKARQDVHFAVVDIDTGSRDLQQCADAVIRMRAEYLFGVGCEDRVSFDFTSGDEASWSSWAAGSRPQVRGNEVSWRSSAARDASYSNFRRYLDSVFSYAGSASLERELLRVEDSSQIQAGDVFIQGGFPGHAVLVLDVAADSAGQRIFLLAQSYMPAQDFHLLRNPQHRDNPWYETRSNGSLATPEWTFGFDDLHRFESHDCESGD